MQNDEYFSKLRFVPVLPAGALESTIEVSETLEKKQLYVSAVEIFEKQGYDISVAEGLSLDEYKWLRNATPRGTKLAAKIVTAYEAAALAEAEKVKTLAECRSLSGKLHFESGAHKRLAERAAELRLAEARALLASRRSFDAGRTAMKMLDQRSAEWNAAVAMMAEFASDTWDCIAYLKEVPYAANPAGFRRVLDRLIGHYEKDPQHREYGRDREQGAFQAFYSGLESLATLIAEKVEIESPQKQSYLSRIKAVLTAQSHAFIEKQLLDARYLREVEELRYVLSKEALQGAIAKRIFERALELTSSDLLELCRLIGASWSKECWREDATLKAKAMAAWESAAGAAVAEKENWEELWRMLELLPPKGAARKQCLSKIVERIDDPAKAYSFAKKCGEEHGETAIAKALLERYEALARKAMQSAVTPAQIVKAMQLTKDRLPDVYWEGLAKLASFYRIPEAKAA